MAEKLKRQSIFCKEKKDFTNVWSYYFKKFFTEK